MIAIVALFLIVFASLIIYGRSRLAEQGRPGLVLEPVEHLALSFAFGAGIQFLFFTMIPGWIVVAMLLGKGGFWDTPTGSQIWAAAMATANLLIYVPITYFIIRSLSNWYQRKNGGEPDQIASIIPKI